MYREDPLMQVRYAELLGFGASTGLAGVGIEAAGNVAPAARAGPPPSIMPSAKAKSLRPSCRWRS